jgi:hypothetical protein
LYLLLQAHRLHLQLQHLQAVHEGLPPQRRRAQPALRLHPRLPPQRGLHAEPHAEDEAGDQGGGSCHFPICSVLYTAATATEHAAASRALTSLCFLSCAIPLFNTGPGVSGVGARVPQDNVPKRGRAPVGAGGNGGGRHQPRRGGGSWGKGGGGGRSWSRGWSWGGRWAGRPIALAARRGCVETTQTRRHDSCATASTYGQVFFSIQAIR